MEGYEIFEIVCACKESPWRMLSPEDMIAMAAIDNLRDDGWLIIAIWTEDREECCDETEYATIVSFWASHQSPRADLLVLQL